MYIDPLIPKISVSEIRIRQVFQNIISNCIKFNDKEEGRIRIYSKTSASGDQEFFIEDNGTGIAESNIKNIFEPFKSFRGGPEDSGLGMAIVKKIINYLGGTIMVESELGKKTIVRFILPQNLILHNSEN